MFMYRLMSLNGKSPLSLHFIIACSERKYFLVTYTNI